MDRSYNPWSEEDVRSVRGGLCQLEGCSRTRHPDYEYCGKSHGIEAMRRRGQQQQKHQMPFSSPRDHPDASTPSPFFSREVSEPYWNTTTKATCKLPGCSKDVFPGFDYCGRTHGKQARQGQIPFPSPYPTPFTSPSASLFQARSSSEGWPPASSMSLFNQHLDQNPRRGTCKLPGCSMQAFPGYEYCSRTHGKQASQPQQPIDQTPSVRQLNLFDQKLPDDASFPLPRAQNSRPPVYSAASASRERRVPFPREYAQPTLALPCDQPGCNRPASEGYTECGTKECNKARLRRRIEPIVQELKDANLKCLNPDCNESLEWGNFCSRPCEVRVHQQEATRAWEQRTKLEHQSREGEYTRFENLTFDGLRKCAGLHCTKSAVVGYEPFCGQECKTTHAQLEDDDPAKVNISQATFNVLLKQADELRKEIPSKCANPPCSYPPFKNREVCSKRCLMELEAHRSGSK